MDSVCLNLETIVQTQDVISANSTSKSDKQVGGDDTRRANDEEEETLEY